MSSTQEPDYASLQAGMLADILAEFRAAAGLTGCAQMSATVAAAITAVPRHGFVRKADRANVYGNSPWSIGHRQTISQPFIVALMTELAALSADQTVLEIGTGCGYQTAVLAELAKSVHSVEIIAVLANGARRRLKNLGYRNVTVHCGDGNLGWPAAAPYDAIVVTAGGRLPAALIEQLKPGGRLIIPVDLESSSQELVLITKGADGNITRRAVLPVRFVPLVRPPGPD